MSSTIPTLAISIRQPWAELILLGRKTIEVRSWTTPHRGALFLHTGAKPAKDAINLFPELGELTLGSFIGTMEIVSVEAFTQSSWIRERENHLVPGPMPQAHFGWRLASAKRIEPIAGQGRLGLFPVPEEVRNRTRKSD